MNDRLGAAQGSDASSPCPGSLAQVGSGAEHRQGAQSDGHQKHRCRDRRFGDELSRLCDGRRLCCARAGLRPRLLRRPFARAAASPPMPSRSKRCSSSRRRSASSRSSLPGYPSSRSVRHSSRRTLCYTPQQSKRRPAVYALPRLRWRCPGCSPKRPRCCSSPEHRRCHHLEENPAAAELVLDEVALVTLDQAACS